MTSDHEQKLRVFYSWQSDLPGLVNMQLIRNSLNDAAGVINGDHDQVLHVLVDEATREVPGSPNIADSIFAKIRVADVFVCDLTKTAEFDSGKGKRKFCNPNVAIELGYAVSVLGWSRIVLVFNQAYGVIPDDLPFDARGHRTSLYRCLADVDANGKLTTNCKTQINNASGALRTKLVDSLGLISRENPKRPHELETKSPDAVRRERDIEQLNKLFYWIHLHTMDYFIDRLGISRLTSIGCEFFDCFEATVESTTFHVNNKALELLIQNFYSAWKDCFRHTMEMDLSRNGQELCFLMPGDRPISIEQGEHCDYTAGRVGPLRIAFDALLNCVREHYLEINLNTCGSEAVTDYYKRRQEDKQAIT